jgi:hypothetical protein
MGFWLLQHLLQEFFISLSKRPTNNALSETLPFIALNSFFSMGLDSM